MLSTSSARCFALLSALFVTASCGRIGYDWLGASAQQDASFGELDAGVGSPDASFGELDAAPLDILDPPSLAGMWSIDSVTYDSTGQPVVVPRATGGDGVLGEFELTSTGPNTFSYQASTMVIDQNLPVDYNASGGTMEILPDTLWLLDFGGGEVAVASASLDGDLLSVNWVKSDPRNNLTDTIPLATVLRRNYGFEAASAGAWVSTRIEYASGKVYTPTACVDQGGGEWVRNTLDMQTDSLLRFTVNDSWAIYSDSSCTNLTNSGIDFHEGITQENGTRLQIFGEEPSDFGPFYLDSQLSFQGGNLRIDVTGCLPSPACNDLAQVMVFQPATSF